MRLHDLLEAARNFRYRVEDRRSEFAALAAGQSPTILFITCSDSRVIPSLITNARPGQLFEVRIEGPVLPAYPPAPACQIAASLDHGVDALEIRHIVVCGHSHCGTVEALYEGSVGKYGPSIDRWLRLPHVRALRSTDERSFLEQATERHVVAQLAALRKYPKIAERVDAGTVTLHGWYYEISTGKIRGYDPMTQEFAPL